MDYRTGRKEKRSGFSQTHHDSVLSVPPRSFDGHIWWKPMQRKPVPQLAALSSQGDILQTDPVHLRFLYEAANRSIQYMNKLSLINS